MKIALAGRIGASVVGLAVAAAGVANAQGAMPKHEFGVDLGLAYHNIASPIAGGNSVSQFHIFTPVDVRVGFVSQRPLSFEGRLVASFLTASSGGVSATVYSFEPGVNLLYKLGAGQGPHGLLGPYLTGGVGLGVFGYSDGTKNSGLNVTINAGIGTRGAFGSGATRGEFFVAFTPKNRNIGPDGNEFAIGVRLGISLWH